MEARGVPALCAATVLPGLPPTGVVPGTPPKGESSCSACLSRAPSVGPCCPHWSSGISSLSTVMVLFSRVPVSPESTKSKQIYKTTSKQNQRGIKSPGFCPGSPVYGVALGQFLELPKPQFSLPPDTASTLPSHWCSTRFK